MNWNSLTSLAQLDELETVSFQKPVLIFKHSTRCSISSGALNRLERQAESSLPFIPYFLDLISFREISNRIAEKFGVEHQSPQVLLIKNGQCVYHESHMGINYHELQQASSMVS
jgi:bacillithiol system protein YtxJ